MFGTEYVLFLLAVYSQMLDGVNALTIGCIGDELEPLVFAGGNCSVQGVDIEGNDKYWTVCFHILIGTCMCIFLLHTSKYLYSPGK